jgi:hypothetical protein
VNSVKFSGYIQKYKATIDHSHLPTEMSGIHKMKLFIGAMGPDINNIQGKIKSLASAENFKSLIFQLLGKGLDENCNFD